MIYELRIAAAVETGLDEVLDLKSPGGSGQEQSQVIGPESFLDTEIVAIYW